MTSPTTPEPDEEGPEEAPPTTPESDDEQPEEERPDGASVHPMPLRGTESARFVRTPFVKAVDFALARIRAVPGIVLIDGPAGQGKTFAVEATAHAPGHETYRVSFTGANNLTQMHTKLIGAITGAAPTGRHLWQMDAEINELLSVQKCTVVIDECQWADQRLLRVLRAIYDDRTSEFGLVMLGMDVAQALERKEPGLASRVGVRIYPSQLARPRLVATLSEYHPLFANTDPAVIAQMWQSVGGVWREWAHILNTAAALRLPTSKGLSSAQARDILRFMGKRP